jgi:hypothetical protein
MSVSGQEQPLRWTAEDGDGFRWRKPTNTGGGLTAKGRFVWYR